LDIVKRVEKGRVREVARARPGAIAPG
jgi:hypothetical protein